MFDSIRKFLSDLAEGETHESHFQDDDYRLAAAALLVHAATIDGNVSDAERTKLRDLLQQRFALDDAMTDELVREATEAEQESVDLYRFTSLLNRKLNEEGRLRIIEMLWEIAYVDGKATELEDNMIWRAADLLGVSSRDRVNLRQSVIEANKLSGQDE